MILEITKPENPDLQENEVLENVGVVGVNARIVSVKNGCPIDVPFTVRFKTDDGTAGIVAIVIVTTCFLIQCINVVEIIG